MRNFCSEVVRRPKRIPRSHTDLANTTRKKVDRSVNEAFSNTKHPIKDSF